MATLTPTNDAWLDRYVIDETVVSKQKHALAEVTDEYRKRIPANLYSYLEQSMPKQKIIVTGRGTPDGGLLAWVNHGFYRPSWHASPGVISDAMLGLFRKYELKYQIAAHELAHLISCECLPPDFRDAASTWEPLSRWRRGIRSCPTQRALRKCARTLRTQLAILQITFRGGSVRAQKLREMISEVQYYMSDFEWFARCMELTLMKISGLPILTSELTNNAGRRAVRPNREQSIHVYEVDASIVEDFWDVIQSRHGRI